MAYERQYYQAQIKITKMNGSGDFQLENADEQLSELQTFEIIVETLSSEVTVQFWVLVLFGVVIFVVLLGEFKSSDIFILLYSPLQILLQQ